jgi:hypothetical protein
MRHFFAKIPGQVYLWLAVPILAASSSVVRKLTELGAMQSIHGHNPISFCNVLFAGNLCALTVLVAVYHRGQFDQGTDLDHHSDQLCWYLLGGRYV